MILFKRWHLLFWIALAWNKYVDSFIPQTQITLAPSSPVLRRGLSAFDASDTNEGINEDDDGGAEQDMFATSPETSRMADFIAEYLNKAGQESALSSTTDWDDDDDGDDHDASSFTHLVAMPVDNCHELMLELESVQRAILYHCPILVHACIQQAITRLPLLYVKTSGPSASAKLFSIVEDVIEDHLLQPVEDTGEEFDEEELNEYGTRPFTMKFNSLEIDGARNEVLQAVATVDDSNKLRTIVEDLQQRIQRETNWPTLLPPDPQEDYFRARIPFMRLPEDWDNLLEKPEGTKEGDLVFLPSDEGGNGISPIFWGKWADDDFGTARMREIAVFKRKHETVGLDEKSFYLPEKYLSLPEGNAAMTKQEVHYQDYQEKRMLEAEGIEADVADGVTPQQPELAEDDTLLQMTKERLEALYSQGLQSDNETTSNTSGNGEDEDDVVVNEGLVEKPIDPATLDDWTRDRIKNIVDSRAKVQSEKELSKSKNKPPIEENEIFRKFKEGTLAPKPEPPAPAPELPPFPSREHCVGFWKVLESPTGFDVEETDSTRSDNLVLRVDGTTAGGPILDQTTRQKASGGTWRLEGDNLRIRLIIPPGKERILVMQGTLQLISAKSDINLAPSTFGIPDLEARKARSAVEMEDAIYCSGTVWVEDAVTRKNRSDVGTFSLMKINTSSGPRDFTITIPQPIRNQD